MGCSQSAGCPANASAQGINELLNGYASLPAVGAVLAAGAGMLRRAPLGDLLAAFALRRLAPQVARKYPSGQPILNRATRP